MRHRPLRRAAGPLAARAAAALLVALALGGVAARPAAAQFAFENDFNSSGKCITAPDNALQVPGGGLTIVKCDGRPAQSIVADVNRHLVLFGGQRDRSGSLLCASHPGPAGQWVRLQALPCEEGTRTPSSQNWTPETGGLVRGDFGWCLATDGVNVYLLGCNAANHRATWTLRPAAPAPPAPVPHPTTPVALPPTTTVQKPVGIPRSAPEMGACRDPWITQAVLDVAGRKPMGAGDGGECDPQLYGDGHWSDYEDLKLKVIAHYDRQTDPFGHTPLPVCDDAWITRAVRTVSREVRGAEEVRGSGTIGECNPSLYGNSWSSEAELLGYVRESFRALKAAQLQVEPGGRTWGDLRYSVTIMGSPYVGPEDQAPQRNAIIHLPNGYVVALDRRCPSGYKWDFAGCLIPEYRP